jgi:hypothetical protein
VMGGDAREYSLDAAKLEVCLDGLLLGGVKSGAREIFEETDRAG